MTLLLYMLIQQLFNECFTVRNDWCIHLVLTLNLVSVQYYVLDDQEIIGTKENVNIYVQGNCLESCDWSVTYKSLGLSREDSLQVIEMIHTYSDLLDKIQQCNLPRALKASAFNNLALAKNLHHFYKTRLSEEQL